MRIQRGGFNFLDPKQATKILKLISRVTPRSALVGGLAMNFYGSPRLTQDLDIVSDRSLPSSPQWSPRTLLTFGGRRYRTREGVSLDVIVRNDAYAELYADALDLAPSTQLGFRIVTPEYLFLMKMASGREKDHSDMMYLLVHRRINAVTTRKLVGRYLGGRFAQDEFDRLMDEAIWLRSRSRGESP